MVQLVNKQKAAALLGISPFSINRLMAEIGYVKVGKRRVMIPVENIENYIKRKEVQPKARKESQP